MNNVQSRLEELIISNRILAHEHVLDGTAMSAFAILSGPTASSCQDRVAPNSSHSMI